MRNREGERKISSNTATFLADIIRVTRKTKKKTEGYNQAEAFEFCLMLKAVFNELEECERQRLIQQTEDIQEKINTLKDTLKNLKDERETGTTNNRQQEEIDTEDELGDNNRSFEHQAPIVTTAADPHIVELEDLSRTYLDYYNIRMEGENTVWTARKSHTTTHGFSNTGGGGGSGCSLLRLRQ